MSGWEGAGNSWARYRAVRALWLMFQFHQLQPCFLSLKPVIFSTSSVV